MTPLPGQLALFDPAQRPVRVLENMSDWWAEQPHYCAVCLVQLDQDAVRQGNDGCVLCPEHIGTIA